ncbi:MAG: hypothetical protein ACPF9D_10670 [Owenweeksia sp.]
MRNYHPSPFWPFVRGVIFTIVVLICLVMCSCSQESSRELAWLIDNSPGQVNMNRDSSEKMYEFLESNVLNIAGDSDFSGGLKVYVVCMGESARPRINLVYLEAGEHWLFATRKKREAQVEEFKANLKAALEEATSAPLDQSSSQLHHAICYTTRIMCESNFSRDKQLYCFSDGIENSDAVSFNDYAYQLDQFEQSYPEISEKLNASCPLPDMSGIKFHLFNSPGVGTNQLVLACSRFWEYHLERAGATFRVRSNLSF